MTEYMKMCMFRVVYCSVRYASNAVIFTDSSASERECPQDVAELVLGESIPVHDQAIQFGASENIAE